MSDEHTQQSRVDGTSAVRAGGTAFAVEPWGSRLLRRSLVHAAIFCMSFLCSAGVFFVGVLVWVRSLDYLSLVVVSLVSGVVFVALFSWLRMYILHRVFDEYPDKEDDPGHHFHRAKSVAYGLVALVFAVLLAGLLVSMASARDLPRGVLGDRSVLY